MIQYYCTECESKFRQGFEPVYCPKCGAKGSVVQDVRNSRETALRLIDELEKEDIPVLESVRQGFVAQWALVESKMQTLRKYKSRGVIKDFEMPQYQLKTTNQALKEYRQQRKNDGQTKEK